MEDSNVRTVSWLMQTGEEEVHSEEEDDSLDRGSDVAHSDSLSVAASSQDSQQIPAEDVDHAADDGAEGPPQCSEGIVPDTDVITLEETYPTRHITVQMAKGTFMAKVRVVPNMPLLIGRDWPIFERDIEDHCRACPECQRIAPRPLVWNPLIPMPLIEVPFERLALDSVGPLPRTSRVHHYILSMVDYATRYPEAVPLRAAKAVTRELMILFSRVGIVREILTDQGSCFMSRVLKVSRICNRLKLSLLQIRHLQTSVYHPQTGREV